MRACVQMTVLRRALTALLLPLAGCAGPAHVQVGAVLPAEPPAESVIEARYPGAEGVLRGIETANAQGAWRTGDRVLIGLSFSRGDSEFDRMLLVQLLGEPGKRPTYRRRVGVYDDEIWIESATRATRLRLFEADGTPVSDQTGQFVELFLDYGPAEVARIGGGYAISTNDSGAPTENPRPENDLETLRPGVYGLMSLLAFGEGAGDSPTLSQLIRRAFTVRQEFGLLLSMGRFQIRIGDSTPLPREEWPVEGLGVGALYSSEIIVSVNGSEALRGRAILAPCDAPLGLCGGIVWGDLTNVANPEIRATFHLLGAARGPEDTNIDGTSATPAE